MHVDPGDVCGYAAITLHFRNADLTRACVDSLLADGWCSVLVWDNTEDGALSVLPLQQRYAGDSRVVFASAGKNLGFGRGMNAALAQLAVTGYRGPVLLVNNDATIQMGMRRAMAAALSGPAVPTLIAPRVEQGAVEEGWMHYHPWFALVTRRAWPGSFAYLSGCCLLVARPDNAQPLFDETFFMYGEDVELSWRWRREGGRLVLLDRVWVVHAGSAGSGVASDFYERNLVRAHWKLASRLAANGSHAVGMRSLRLPLLFTRALLRAARFGSWRPLQALSELVR